LITKINTEASTLNSSSYFYKNTDAEYRVITEVIISLLSSSLTSFFW